MVFSVSKDGVVTDSGSQVHLLARPRALPEGGEGVRFAYQTHYARGLSGGCGFSMICNDADGDFDFMRSEI